MNRVVQLQPKRIDVLDILQLLEFGGGNPSWRNLDRNQLILLRDSGDSGYRKRVQQASVIEIQELRVVDLRAAAIPQNPLAGSQGANHCQPK